VGYSIYGDYGEDSPPGKIIAAVATREIDVAIVWGPIAGYFAKQQAEAMRIIPVPPDAASPSLPFSYNIAVGVRQGNDALKTQLTELLQRKAPEIAQILSDYGVPTVQD
jgi:mxaJ protein